MVKRREGHFGYYISLAAILFLGFLLVSLSPNKQFQMTMIVLTSVFYVIWGIVHHLLNHDLTLKIVVEYILIGSLGLTVVFFLLKGGLGI